jgi:hypothetical protein
LKQYGDEFEGYQGSRFEMIDGQQPLSQRLGREGHYYPAIAMPLGPEHDSITCPPEHIEALEAWLKARELDVLVIGYSGLDTDVLGRVRDARPSIRSLCIVNKGEEATMKTTEALQLRVRCLAYPKGARCSRGFVRCSTAGSGVESDRTDSPSAYG